MNSLTTALWVKVCQFLDQPSYCAFFKTWRKGCEISQLNYSRSQVRTTLKNQGLAFKYCQHVTLLVGRELKAANRDVVKPTIVVPYDLQSLHIINNRDLDVPISNDEMHLVDFYILCGYGVIGSLTLQGVIILIGTVAPSVNGLSLINSCISREDEVLENITTLVIDEVSHDNSLVERPFKNLTKVVIGYTVYDVNEYHDFFMALISSPLQILELLDFRSSTGDHLFFHSLPITLTDLTICLKIDAFIPYRALDAKSCLPNLLSFRISGNGKLMKENEADLPWTNLDLLRDSLQLETLEIALKGECRVNIRSHVAKMHRLQRLNIFAAVEYRGGNWELAKFLESTHYRSETQLMFATSLQLDLHSRRMLITKSKIFQSVLKIAPP